MGSTSGGFYEFGDFRFYPRTHVLFRGDERVDATPKALAILSVLIENRGQVVSKEELLERVWPDTHIEEANISHHIFRLRRCFEGIGDKVIETVPKRGYRFVPASTFKSEEPAFAESSGVDRRRSISRVVLAVGAALVAIAGVVAYLALRDRSEQTRASTPSAYRTIAVLPFRNDSGNDEAAYLADGISETLTNSLSTLPSVRVKARSATAKYRDRDVSAKVLGEEMNVDIVLLGRIAQRDEQLTVSLSMVDARTEFQLWGKQYVSPLSDLAKLQNSIGRDVAGSIRSGLTSTEEADLSKMYSQNSEAYRNWLLGNFYWGKFTADGLRTAVTFYEKAIAIDPDYALAYAGLANSYNVLGVNSHMPASETRGKVKAFANRAVAIDGNLAQARLALGAYKLFYEWDLEGAEAEFRMASELDKTYAVPHELLAYKFRAQRRFEEMFAEIQRARELDPLDLLIYSDLANCYRFAGDVTRAIEINQEVLQMDPNFADLHFENGLAHDQAGLHDVATAEMHRALEAQPKSRRFLAGLGIVHAGAGRKAEALRVIKQLLDQTAEPPINPLDIARIYARLGQRDDAFAWLERAVNERTCWLFELDVDPDWASLRSDPRFEVLSQRVGLRP